MTRKTSGLILILLGLTFLAICLGADLIGIGNQTGIGWKQLSGAALGACAAIVGAWLAFTKPKT